MANFKKISTLFLVSSAVCATLIGCGGGSSSSESTSVGSIAFPTTATTAEPTLENGQKVEEVVAQDQSTLYAINAVSSESNTNMTLTTLKIGDVVKENAHFDFYALNETINETEVCDNGGSLNYTGSGSETSGGSVTMTFNNCEMDGATINGNIQADISGYNASYYDFSTYEMTYLTDVTISYDSISAKTYQGSTVKMEMIDWSNYIIKLSMSVTSDIGGTIAGQQDSIYYIDAYSYYPSMYQTQGRIYIDNLASYVDYDTSYDMSQTPFVFDYSGLASGEAHYNMANGGKLKIVAQNYEAITYVDADGDGTYELIEE